MIATKRDKYPLLRLHTERCWRKGRILPGEHYKGGSERLVLDLVPSIKRMQSWRADGYFSFCPASMHMPEQRDGISRRGGLLPSVQRHSVHRKRGERPPFDQIARSDHAEEHHGKDVRLPIQLQRAMAAEAEAAREARAKVIAAEGEQKASRALREASEVIGDSPAALQLRYLQTLNTISTEKNSTIVFPLPIDIITYFMKAMDAKE
nr:unnamed protein product [Callosobruchus chinensis]